MKTPAGQSNLNPVVPAGYRRPMSCDLVGPRDLAILRDVQRGESRVPADGVDDLDRILAPITVQQIEDLVNELEADPRRVAARVLELERDVQIMRAHLESIELRIAGGAR